MIQIAPFRPLRYNPEKVSFISRVVAPPFDLIDQEDGERLRRQDEHNVIRLILGREGQRRRDEQEYLLAAETLAAWRRDGVLVREDRPAVYVCEQSFALHGEHYVRHGLMCAMLLEEFSTRRVLPHERTMAEPKADRFRLMQACRANLSPIFGVCSDTEGRADELTREMAQGSPLYGFRGSDGIVCKLWRVDEPEPIRRIALVLRRETLFIADGHHRYETALRYRQEHRSTDGPPASAPEDFLLVFCVSARNAGLKILPTHRLVRAPDGFDEEALLQALGDRFEVTQRPVQGPEGLKSAFLPSQGGREWIGLYLGRQRLFALRPRCADPLAELLPDQLPEWRRLPVTQLHYGVLEPLLGIQAEARPGHPRLAFCEDVEAVYWHVESGRFDAAFLLPPIGAPTVEAVARAGQRMPPKSTFFYPKIPSGLLFYPFDNNDCLPRIAGD